MYPFIHDLNEYHKDFYPKPWIHSISLVSSFELFFGVVLNVKSDSPWDVFNNNTKSYSAFNIVFIAGNATLPSLSVPVDHGVFHPVIECMCIFLKKILQTT